MRKRVIAAILILANVVAMASCSIPGNTRSTGETADPDTSTEEHERSFSEEKVYENVEKITVALAACDFDDLSSRCVYTPYTILNIMPVIEEDEDDDSYKVTDNMLLIRNMIASTITCEIDEESYKASLLDKKYSVDVKFSFKDYTKISGKRERFLGAADFNSLMLEEEGTIDQIITLEFEKKDKHYLLANPDALKVLYDYDLPELEFMKNCFDMIETSYMTGDGWDSFTESYIDTNTFEFEIVLDLQAREYIWQYIYAVSEETVPEWNHIYTSEVIVDKYPTSIHLTYTQEENFSTGYYCFVIYDVQSEQIYGWEFSVYNTAETQTDSTTSGTVPDPAGNTDTADVTDTTDATTETT